MGGDRASPPPASSPKNPCKVCGKIFPNGRSLGGHMRTHAREAGGSSTAAKERLKDSYLLRESPNKMLKSRPSHLNDDDKEIVYWCEECGRAFHSSGGFTRHMRCHSDREPRNAPGLEGRRTNAAGDGGRHDVNVTAPRTKSQSERTPPASNDGRDAAVNPTEDVERNVSNKKLIDLKTAEHPDNRNDSKNVGSDASFSGVAKENDHELLKKQEHEVPSTGGSNADTVSMKPGIDRSGSAVVRKRPFGADDGAKPDAGHANYIISSDATLFKCIHCGKNFISYQALGDHRDRYRFAGCLLHNILGTEKTFSTCVYCGKTFISNEALNNHLAKYKPGGCLAAENTTG